MKSLFKNKRIASIAQDFSTKPAAIAPAFQLHSSSVLDLIGQLPQLIWGIGTQQQHFFSPTLCTYLGQDLNILPIESWQSFIHPEDLTTLLCIWQKHKILKHNFEQNCRIRNAQHEYRWFKVSGQYQATPFFQWMFSCQDIHDYMLENTQLIEQLYKQKNILEASHDCIKVLLPSGHLIYINDFGCEFLALSKDDLIGQSWLDVLNGPDKEKGEIALAKAAKGQVSRFSSTMPYSHAKKYWDNILTPIRDQNDNVVQILCVSRDISQQIQTEQRLEYASLIDDLTQLYNRKAFNALLKDNLLKAEIEKSYVGLLILDFDYFKHLNDTLGHLAGDHLLQVFASRLRKCFSQTMLLSRFGNDEFAIVIPNLESKNQLILTAELALKQLEAPIRYAGKYINSGMSIGCAIYPNHATDPAHLIRCADTALSELKHNGHGGILVFNQQMLDTLEDTVKELNLARDLLRRHAFMPYYQPKVNLQTQKIIGFEALLRWSTPQGDIRTPSHISEAFSDYELATRIGESMQHQVFQDIANWLKQKLIVQPISINAAPVEFLRDNYAETLLERLAQYQIPHHLIEIEITEQSLAERGGPYVLRAVKQLKQVGIRIALDDFGTGYSSLTRLKDYHVDVLKIDRSFIEKMHDDPCILAIVKAIGQLGPSMQIDILAEGIEQAEHVNTLQACQCFLGQGFFFYRPMPAADVLKLLKNID